MPDVRHQVEEEAEADDHREALEAAIDQLQIRFPLLHLARLNDTFQLILAQNDWIKLKSKMPLV